jgi:hypothetical protein
MEEERVLTLEMERLNKANLESDIRLQEEQRVDCRRELRANKQEERDRRRPSRTLYPEIYRGDEGWVCEHGGVIAYGDSPEIATDNFDHLWLYGDGDGKAGS